MADKTASAEAVFVIEKERNCVTEGQPYCHIFHNAAEKKTIMNYEL